MDEYIRSIVVRLTQSGRWAALLCACLAFVSHADVSSYSGGGVTMDTLLTRYRLQTADPSRLTIVDDPSGSGRKVFRFELRNTDEKVANGQRTEVFAAHETITEGRRWYAYSYFFPADWPAVAEGKSILIGQVHTNQPNHISLSPPFALMVQSDDIFLLSASNTASWADSSPPTQENSSIKKMWLGTIERNQWMCVVLDADWAWKQGQGKLKIWLNGKVVYFSKFEPNSYETELGNYPKIGMYAPYSMDAPTRFLYADFIRIGEDNSSYEEMNALTPCSAAPVNLVAPAIVE